MTDLNVFTWPGVDLYPIPQAAPGTYAYGFLPSKLFEQVMQGVRAHMGRTPPTGRTG